MGIRKVIKENWITRKMPEGGIKSTLFLVLLLMLGSSLYLNDLWGAGDWMPASAYHVLSKHEYWRLWSALFAHGDLSHILGNLFLFVPFAYFLSHYFSVWLFPFIGFLLGGLINFIVIQTLPMHATIIGVSGVVYWMGATWMSLAFLIDRREAPTQRFLKLTGVSIVLFFPTTFMAEVSYLSHFLGYVLGVVTGTVVYLLFRERFRRAEVIQEINENELYVDWENFSVENIVFRPVDKADVSLLHEWLGREHVAKNWRPKKENVFPFIVYLKEKPIGYIESYDVGEGTLGVDLFLADKNLQNKGIGSTFLKKFTDLMLQKEGVLSIIATPTSFNAPAIRAFKKAGFRRMENRMTLDVPCVLMEKKK
ncbi:MAG: GNAT family N-acetyltransferase [Bacteriovorax sp.]